MMGKEIDLVLSGSGVRLGCHVGAVLALRDKAYSISRIIGTSGGAIIAAAYFCHPNFSEITTIIRNIDFNDLMSDGKWTSWIRLVRSSGLYLGDKFQSFIEKYITYGKYMRDVPGLNIVVTNLSEQSPIVINSTNYPTMKVSEAVRMSMSAPLYWIPKTLKVNNKVCTIIDGGISANYFIDYFNDNIRPTIGISLYTKDTEKSFLDCINYFKNILNTIMISNENEHIDDANWANTIKIDTADISPFDLDITREQIEWTIKHGYDVTTKVINTKLNK